MENLGKKAGYLKGLLDAMNADDSLNAKLMTGIVELLGDICTRIETMDELIDDLNDYVESIDDDLAELEGEQDEDSFNFLHDDEDEEDFDDFDEVEDQLHLLRSNLDASGPDSLTASVCPECIGTLFFYSNGNDKKKYICPHCSKIITPVPINPDNAPVAKPFEE